VPTNAFALFSEQIQIAGTTSQKMLEILSNLSDNLENPNRRADYDSWETVLLTAAMAMAESEQFAPQEETSLMKAVDSALLVGEKKFLTRIQDVTPLGTTLCIRAGFKLVIVKAGILAFLLADPADAAKSARAMALTAEIQKMFAVYEGMYLHQLSIETELEANDPAAYGVLFDLVPLRIQVRTMLEKGAIIGKM